MFADICTGLISILTPETIGAVALGIFTGLMFGAIPGISGIMAISILLPLTFYVSPLVGIPMLLGIYKASMFGGSITAVLLNTPGAPPAVCTAMDGYPLTKQGKAGKGLNAALVGSVFGDTFSNILLICVAAPLSYLTLKVGPVEQCSLILLALTVVGSISGSSILKGILCAGVGILLATVGVSGTTGAMRFTFENENLMSGIALIPMVIGLLCLPEVIHQACSGIRKTFEQSSTFPAKTAACRGRKSRAASRSCSARPSSARSSAPCPASGLPPPPTWPTPKPSAPRNIPSSSAKAPSKASWPPKPPTTP